MKFTALVKDVNIKTLVSGDKSARLVLETLYPQDVKKFAELSERLEISVEVDKEDSK